LVFEFITGRGKGNKKPVNPCSGKRFFVLSERGKVDQRLTNFKQKQKGFEGNTYKAFILLEHLPESNRRPIDYETC